MLSALWYLISIKLKPFLDLYSISPTNKIITKNKTQYSKVFKSTTSLVEALVTPLIKLDIFAPRFKLIDNTILYIILEALLYKTGSRLFLI